MKNQTIVTATKKEVLQNVGRNTFRFIRESVGIDFQKPVIINKISGPFTIKNVWKILPHIDYDYTVCATVKNNKAAGYSNEWRIVEIDSNSFEIELKSATYFNFKTIPGVFFRKGDFEELRKNNNCVCYIVAQKTEYVLEPVRRPRYGAYTFDENHRYIIKKNTNRSLNVIDINKTGKSYCYEPYSRFITGKEEDPSTFFDKSGYFIRDRKNRLYAAAAKLRAERKKAAFLACDMTKYIEKAKTQIEKVKQTLIEKIKVSKSYDQYKQIDRAFTTFEWIIFDFELFEKRIAGKEYTSIENAENAYSKIIEKTNKFYEEINK